MCRQHEGSHTKLVGRVDVGACLYQMARRIQGVPVRRPGDCSRTVGLWAIHIDGPRVQEIPGRLEVLSLYRVNKSGLVAVRRRRLSV